MTDPASPKTWRVLHMMKISADQYWIKLTFFRIEEHFWSSDEISKKISIINFTVFCVDLEFHTCFAILLMFCPFSRVGSGFYIFYYSRYSFHVFVRRALVSHFLLLCFARFIIVFNSKDNWHSLKTITAFVRPRFKSNVK